MGIVENPLFWAGAGTAVNSVGNFFNQRGQQRRSDRMEERALGSMQDGPGFLESLLRQQFNVGQDGEMQMLRSIPGTQQFDTSDMFEALQPVRQRQLQEGLGALRSGAPGLGQRFGSAMMRGEEQMLLNHLQNVNAQDAGIQMQSFESAQGRQLGAGMNLMQLLGQMEQGRRGQNMQALGLGASMPQGGPPNFGQPMIDIGQLMLLQQLLSGNGGNTTQQGAPLGQPMSTNPLLGTGA